MAGYAGTLPGLPRVGLVLGLAGGDGVLGWGQPSATSPLSRSPVSSCCAATDDASAEAPVQPACAGHAGSASGSSVGVPPHSRRDTEPPKSLIALGCGSSPLGR